jgi:hypothetical protein
MEMVARAPSLLSIIRSRSGLRQHKRGAYENERLYGGTRGGRAVDDGDWLREGDVRFGDETRTEMKQPKQPSLYERLGKKEAITGALGPIRKDLVTTM